MRKALQTLAILMAIIAVVWMIGCSEEETTATVLAVNPPEGSKIPACAEIIITFDKPVTGVTVDSIPATGSGISWKFKGDLTRKGSKEISIRIAWINEDGSTGIKSISYIIEAYDNGVIYIVSSRPKDGEKDVDYIMLQLDGMEIQFSVPLKKVDVDVIANGEKLWWGVELSDDKTKVFLWLLKGPDMPYDSSEVILEITAEDFCGNKGEFKITFTTKAME
ncbi:hypothetical protein FJZ31_11660 [Candidatus Poribacteria bacterium]|nr:hypothetical protein [Candidatus Poribacteria bacterium]